MSMLIDDLIRAFSPVAEPAYRRVDNRQYLAKPCYGYGWYYVKQRICDAIKILQGKAFAYHFYEDDSK